MKMLIIIMGVFVFSLSFAYESALFEFNEQEECFPKVCDSIYYHSYHQTSQWQRFTVIQDPWVFVRFTPPEFPWLMTGVWGHAVHYEGIPSSIPCTLAIWDSYPPNPSNLKFLVAYYEPDNGSDPVVIVNESPIYMNGDFCVGFGGVHDPSTGEVISPAMDVTPPATTNRNFYANSRYGTHILYSEYDFHLTVWRCTPEGIGGEDTYSDECYLSVVPNPAPKDRGIIFIYRVFNSSHLKLYELDGRLVGSKLLEPGETSLLWNLRLPSGIYFYKLSTGGRNLCGKFFIL